MYSSGEQNGSRRDITLAFWRAVAPLSQVAAIAPRRILAIVVMAYPCIHCILAEPAMAGEWSAVNYRLGAKHYSLEALEKRFHHIIGECTGRC